jgi:FdhE protein
MIRRARSPDPQTAAVLNRLEALAGEGPDLAQAAAIYRAILPRLRAAQVAQAALPAPALDREAARRKLMAGLPILVGEDLAFDAESAARLLVELCRAVETAGGADANTRAAVKLRRAVERHELDLSALWEALASGDDSRLHDLAAGADVDFALLRLLGQNTLQPTLRGFTEKLDGAVDLDGWQRRLCPICGSPPLLAEVQGKDSARRLRCGMCGAAWSYPRLQCVLCGNADHRSLGYILVQGEAQKYRLQTCDVCHGFVKVVTTFDPTPVDLLAVEDLATLHLDSIAAERGYARRPVQA